MRDANLVPGSPPLPAIRSEGGKRTSPGNEVDAMLVLVKRMTLTMKTNILCMPECMNLNWVYCLIYIRKLLNLILLHLQLLLLQVYLRVENTEHVHSGKL